MTYGLTLPAATDIVFAGFRLNGSTDSLPFEQDFGAAALRTFADAGFSMLLRCCVSVIIVCDVYRSFFLWHLTSTVCAEFTLHFCSTAWALHCFTYINKMGAAGAAFGVYVALLVTDETTP